MIRTWIERALEFIVILLISSLAVLVVVAVGFRKAGAALVWYDEVASILLAWLTYYGAALAALKRAHIGFPRIVDSLSPRFRHPMLVVSETITLVFFVVVAWAGWKVVMMLAGTSLVSLPWVPASLAQSVIPIGAVLYIVAECLSLRDVWDKRPYESELPG